VFFADPREQFFKQEEWNISKTLPPAIVLAVEKEPELTENHLCRRQASGDNFT